MPYPDWIFFPSNALPPEWAYALVDAVASAEEQVSTVAARLEYLTSDGVLLALRERLQALGYQVEASKASADRIKRPVLFGEWGQPAMTYSVDAMHPDLKILLEVEAGRATMGNAIYRDIIESSMIYDAEYLALLVPILYRFANGKASSYRDSRALLSAIYASRLHLPLKGVLLLGY